MLDEVPIIPGLLLLDPYKNLSHAICHEEDPAGEGPGGRALIDAGPHPPLDAHPFRQADSLSLSSIYLSTFTMIPCPQHKEKKSRGVE